MNRTMYIHFSFYFLIFVFTIITVIVVLLQAEVMQQLKFPAQNSDIKKRIEALIERDYLERDSEDNTFYKYLA